MKKKLIVILGPTASGKSGLAVELARKYRGEIISADSRQVYKGLDIGTGKITHAEMNGVKHHLLDVADPRSSRGSRGSDGLRKVFTVADFKKLADKKITEILKRGSVPILCGGTGFYIQAVVDNIILPEVGPDLVLRKKLERRKTKKLFETLKKLDARRAREIDHHNRPRLIRAIEIAKALGKIPTLKDLKAKKPGHDILQIGIKISPEKLQKKIQDRLLARMGKSNTINGDVRKNNMIDEARRLHTKGLSWKRMNELGLEYRYLALYLQDKISRTEMIRTLESEIFKYSKRQMTWFKRDKRVKWFALSEKKKITSTVRGFLK